MAGKIFVASSSIIVPWFDLIDLNTQFQHLFLVYDPDGDPTTTDGMRYIEGAPSDKNPLAFGNLQLAVDNTLAGSPRELETGTVDGDVNDSTDLSPYSEYNYTALDIGTQDAGVVWQQLVDLANSLGTPNGALVDTGLEYKLTGNNSNSVITTLLSQLNINVGQAIPKDGGDIGGGEQISEFLFPGINVIISGEGSDTLYGYQGFDVFIDSNGGEDNFHGGNAVNQVRYDASDGKDTVVYTGNAPGVINVWDTFRAVEDNNGGTFTDVLYSIEKVTFAEQLPGNILDYSHYGQAITANAYNIVDLLAANFTISDFFTSNVTIESGIKVTEASGQEFIAENISKIIGTAFNDTINVSSSFQFIEVDGGDDAASGGDTLLLDGNFTAVSGKGIRVSADGVPHEEGERFAVNIENFETAPGKNGYLIIEEMGHNYLTDLVHVTDGPGYPLSRPVSYTTLSYKEYDESLTFNMYQNTITSALGAVDTFSDPVSIIGSDNGDTYVLRKYDKDYGFLAFDGAHYNLPIFSGTGNDTFTYFRDTPSVSQPVIYGGGDDVVDNSYASEFDLLSMNFIFPIGIDVADISFQVTDVEIASTNPNNGNIGYFIDGVATIGDLGTITFDRQFIYTVIGESGEYRPDTGFTKIGMVTTQTELLEVSAFIDFETRNVSIVTDYFGSTGFNKEAMNINFFNGAYHGTFGSDTINLSEYTLYTGYKAYDGDDSITGSIADNVIYGGAGNDSILLAAGGGYDTVYDTEGNNILRLAGVSSDDVVYARTGNDLRVEIGGGVTIKDYFVEPNTVATVVFEGDISVLLSSMTKDVITVPASAILDTNLGNILIGATGNDSIYGFGGDDILRGGTGDDSLYGGAGDDLYVFQAGDGYDTITDSDGLNILKIEGAISPFQLAYARIDNDLRIEIGSGVTIKDYYVTQNTVSYLQFDDGALFDLSLVATNAVTVPATALLGNNSGNILTGASVDDVIYGFGGSDIINGGSGDDQIYGGSGDDIYQITPYEGFDEIRDEAGSDVIEITGSIHEIYYFYHDDYGFGANFKDYTSGFYAYGDGNSVSDMHVEKVRFSDGFEVNFDDIRYTSVMSDIEPNYFGYFGREVVIGSIADDYISTAGGDDILYGGAGNDSLYGGIDNDILYGGEGDDFLNGEEGNNTLYGGLGSDDYTIILNSPVNYISDTGGEADIIRLGSGVAVFNFVRDADDLVISGFNNQIVIRGQYAADGQSTIEYIEYYGSVIGLDTIPVQEANTAPVAQDDVFTALEGQTVSGSVLSDHGHGADSDADNDVLGVVPAEIVTANGASVLLLSNGNFIYTPLENFNGADSFDYVLNDGQGGTDTGTVFLNITPVNDSPVAQNDSFAVNEDAVLTGNVLADNGAGADSDLDGDNLTVTAGTFATLAGGSVALNPDGSFTYAPVANFNGPDSFVYTVNDGQGGTDTATAFLNVVSVNDAPVAQNDSFAVNEDAVLTGNVLADNGAGADSDLDGDNLTVTAGTFATLAGGSVALNADGSFTYTPVANFNGPDSFTYTVNDGQGGSATAAASITVNAVNDGPEAKDDMFSGTQDAEIEGNLLADNGHGADFDLEGDNLRVVQTVATSAAGGSVILMANGDFAYMPPAGYSGNDSFEYTVTDGNGGLATATAFITLAPVVTNHDPVAQDDSGNGFILQNISGNVLRNDSDPDNHTLQVQPAGLMTANGGLVLLLANGDYTYTPVAGFTGSDSFNYTVLDGQGGSGTATVNLTVGLTGQEILGTAGNNTLNGTKFTDTILGLGGDDKLTGKQGHDRILGGTGSDKLYGEDGNDLLIGGAGADRIEGGKGNDILIGDDVLILTQDFDSDNINFPKLKERVDIDNLAPPGTAALGMLDGDLTSSVANTATITFVESGAGYNNTLGVYNIGADGTILNVDIAFENVKQYKAGDQATLNLPGEPNSDFGFFIIANGFNVNNGYCKTDLENGDLNFIYHYGQADERLAKVTDNGTDISLVFDNGVKETLLKGPVYHTTERGDSDSLNPDSQTHVVSGFTDSHDDTTLRIGFEDLPNTGDADYNDVVFDVTYTPTYLNAGTNGGNDTIYGGAGDDLIIGGMGNDTLYGGSGADTFKYLAGDNGKDTIKDFNMREGDTIDIQDVLSDGYDPLADMIAQNLKLEIDGNKATLFVDADGAANGQQFTAIAVIEGGRDLTLDSMIQNNSLIV